MKLCAACHSSFDDALTFCPRDGEVLQESHEEMVGRVIDGKYEIEGFIAQGGMGAVYRARHILLGDRVVIKTLRPEMRTNAEWLRRFRREGQAARAFRHPNSVTVYDLSAGTDGLIYMVMEYVEGHTLDRELKLRGRFTPAEALEVLEVVADVLDAAHDRGVVHRDLKPENVMLGRGERGETVIKVLDLGIAKLLGAGDAHAAGATALTVAGQILGTPYYMSPEQWGELPRDGSPEVDGRTDVYSLGVICFELVAGRKPLGGATLAELRRQHVAAPPPALEEAAPGVPAAFARAVARAMAKDRADRPQSAGELIDELRLALGLAPKLRARGTRAAGGDTDAPTHPVTYSGEADTARLAPPADTLDRSRAETLLTSDFESPATAGVRADTSSTPRPDTRAGAPRGGNRETVASELNETVKDRPGARAVAEGGHAGAQAAPLQPRRKLAPLVAGGAAALVLLAVVGGWLAWRRAGPREEVSAPAATRGASEAPTPAAAPKVEALSYWLEVFDGKDDTEGRRVAETQAALATEERFRFHFNPRRRGYLYLVGPGGEGNALMTILTTQGARQLKSNLVPGDADFAFPNRRTRLRLAGDGGTEEYTVIFSPTPLAAPSFLNGKSEYELSPDEVREFEEFRVRHVAGALAVRGEGDGRRVAVEVPAGATDEAAPFIFDIRLSHR